MRAIAPVVCQGPWVEAHTVLACPTPWFKIHRSRQFGKVMRTTAPDVLKLFTMSEV